MAQNSYGKRICAGEYSLYIFRTLFHILMKINFTIHKGLAWLCEKCKALRDISTPFGKKIGA